MRRGVPLSSWTIFDFCIPSALLTLIIFLHNPVSSAKPLKCRTKILVQLLRQIGAPSRFEGMRLLGICVFYGPLRMHGKRAKRWRYLLTNDRSLLASQVFIEEVRAYGHMGMGTPNPPPFISHSLSLLLHFTSFRRRRDK